MAPNTILIVEDEPDLRTLLERHLEQEGFDTIAVGTARAALAACDQRIPSLVLLDLVLPDGRGTEVCRQLRASARLAHVPIIILSALGDEIDRVVGLEVGADDYVVKGGLSVRELVLRIRARLRRGPVADRGRERAPVDRAVLSIDHDGHRVWLQGREVELTLTEFKLLCTLADCPGRALSRSRLLRELWGGGVDVRTVDTHIRRLRAKLGPAAGAIATVRGVGYRFEPEALED